jgi:hypothetical protein
MGISVYFGAEEVDGGRGHATYATSVTDSINCTHSPVGGRQVTFPLAKQRRGRMRFAATFINYACAIQLYK